MKRLELKKMGRRDLIDIIYELKKNELRLQNEVDELKQELANRQIVIERAGSIADAALALNHIFEVAQAAADDYLNSVRAGQTPVDDLISEVKCLTEDTPKPADPPQESEPSVPAETPQEPKKEV